MINTTVLLILVFNMIALSIADEKKPDAQALFNNLQFQNQNVYDTIRELTESQINNAKVLGVLKEVDREYFQECGEKCLKKLKELKINPRPNEKFKVEVLFEDFELTKPIAELINTTPFLLRFKDELYTIEEQPENYLLVFPEDKNQRNTSILPATIPFINNSFNEYRFKTGGAIWLKWIKKFAYYYKESFFFHSSLISSSSFNESRCFNSNRLYRGFKGNPKLIDDKNNIISSELIKELFVVGYKFEGDYIRFYFASDEKISNLIDGVTINPSYLVSYFKLHEKYSFRLKRSDLIDENGEVVYFQGFDESGRFNVYCPRDFPQDIEEKLRKGEIRFSDLPEKYRKVNGVDSGEYIGNIQFVCHIKNEFCRNEKDDEKGYQFMMKQDSSQED